MRKRYVLATAAAVVILIGGLWLTLGVLTAPEWDTGAQWVYLAENDEGTWNVTFRVGERVELAVGEAWRVNVTHDGGNASGTRTRFFLVDSLNEAFDRCGEDAPADCVDERPLFAFPLVARETWDWIVPGDPPVRVESRASVWTGDATVTHRFDNGTRLTYTFTNDAPFFTTRTEVHADGRVETWRLQD